MYDLICLLFKLSLLLVRQKKIINEIQCLAMTTNSINTHTHRNYLTSANTHTPLRLAHVE